MPGKKIERPNIGAKTTTKNVDGSLGAICNYCGGYGFTNHINGSSPGCTRCGSTGVEPIDTRALEKKVNDLDTKMDKILKLLEK